MAGTMSQIPPRNGGGGGLRRSFSTKDLRGRGTMRRSFSDNHLLSNKAAAPSIKAAMNVRPKLKNSRSHSGLFNLQLSGAMIPETLKSFLFDPETSKPMSMDDVRDHEIEMPEVKKRGNWVKMIVELGSKWKGTRSEDVESYIGGDDDVEGLCDVEYDEDEDEGEQVVIDRDTFSSLLRYISWSDAKLFSQLAFLCNMAYVIADMKVIKQRKESSSMNLSFTDDI